MKKIYAVERSHGEYEDYKEEILCVFSSEDAANRYMVQVTKDEEEEKKISKDLDAYMLRWRSNWLDVEEAKGFQWLITEHRDRLNKDRKDAISSYLRSIGKGDVLYSLPSFHEDYSYCVYELPYVEEE